MFYLLDGWILQWLVNLFCVKLSQSQWERAPPSSRVEYLLRAHQSIAVLDSDRGQGGSTLVVLKLISSCFPLFFLCPNPR